MIRTEYSKYYTVEEFRQRCGFSNAQRIYKAIKDGRIDGVVKVAGVYMIPLGAVIQDRRIRSGRYVGVSGMIKENMEKNGET